MPFHLQGVWTQSDQPQTPDEADAHHLRGPRQERARGRQEADGGALQMDRPGTQATDVLPQACPGQSQGKNPVMTVYNMLVMVSSLHSTVHFSINPHLQSTHYNLLFSLHQST